MRKIFFLLGFLVVFSTTQAQENNLMWQEDLQLTWDDFQGTPWPNVPMHAMTAAGPSLQFGGEKHNNTVTLHFVVNTFFAKDKSWAQKGEFAVAELLKHEQLHFDIAELFTRKLRKALQDYQYTENFAAEYEQIYEEVNEERALYQELYDQETEHSNIADKQKEWEAKVAEELEALRAYANPSFSVQFQVK